VRNPRRRPRTSDADSLRTAPRRKRSKLNEDTFMPPRNCEEEVVNGSIETLPINGNNLPQPSLSRGRGSRTVDSAMGREAEMPLSAVGREAEMPLRAKKSSVKRPTRGDGATVLVQNERYSVKLLPSTPKELRREGVEYRGSLGPAHHALAVTRERAWIWDYNSHAVVSSPKVFDIPFSVKATDALPFGALVAAVNSTDFGLVLVSGTTGGVVYYDSIERAASLSLFQERRPGVDGSLGNLFSGETVVDLVSADHAGFVVILSSGRLVHLTLRDTQGKPRIFAQFLRANEPGSGGIFGSIRGMLTGGAWRRDVNAVHTRSLGPRGPMQAISLTEKAELQIWDLAFGGQYNFNGTIDCKDVIVEELRKLGSPESEGQAENMATLDFALLDKRSSSTGKALVTPGAELPVEVLLLVQNGTLDNCSYVLVQLSIAARTATIVRTVELDSYRQRSGPDTHARPRLCVPKPQLTAFVTFEDAILLSELNESEIDGPEAQLHASYVQTVFEDTVYLKQSPRFEILDASDDGTHRASSIAFVKGAGLVRTTIADASNAPRTATVPIRNKIEQAVFRDALQEGSIIDFSRIIDDRFSPEEVRQAALQISDEILTSTSSFISDNPTSIETQLAYKAQALRALVTHLRQNYPATSKATFWQLLWNAEKVAAAQQMWKAFEEHKAANSEKKRKRAATLMDEVCALAQRRSADEPDTPSNDDVVRGYFIHRLQEVERLLFIAYDSLEILPNDTDHTPQAKVRLVLEANDLWNQALEAVFRFRMENATVYGILPESLRDGVLTDAAEYAELPEFWTSSKVMLKAVVAMSRISRKLTNEEYEKAEENSEMDLLIPQMGIENPRMIQLMCLIFQERIHWLASRQEEKRREMSHQLQETYDTTRYEECRALADFAQVEAGLKIAEHYHDMRTLTDMIVGETQFGLEELQKGPVDKSAIVQHMDEMTARVGKYFDRFGDEWANAYFGAAFSGGQAGPMFDAAQDHWQDSLTRYLRGDPGRGRLCWINDVIADKDFVHASDVLLDTAMTQEKMLWNKQVELSMSKLAMLAVQEGLEADGVGMTSSELTAALPDRELELINVQNQLYKHLEQEIQSALDRPAELEITMQRVGLRNQDLHNLKQLLEAGLDRVLYQVVIPVEELIDVLTLMECVIVDDPEEHNLEGSEFFLALLALNTAAPHMPQERVETLMQLIWKRCYLYDDWISINSSSGKQSESQTSELLSDTIVFRTLFYIISRGLFADPNCFVRHLMPSECLGAGCAPEDLSWRWEDRGLLDGIVGDLRVQDEQLRGFVEDRRVDGWVERCVGLVQREVEEIAGVRAEGLRVEREFEGKGKVNGHGHGQGFVIKVEEEDERDEGVGGDVEMA